MACDWQVVSQWGCFFIPQLIPHFETWYDQDLPNRLYFWFSMTQIEWMRPSNQKDTVCRGRKDLVATSMFYNICGVNNKWLIFRASLKWSQKTAIAVSIAQVWGLPWKASSFHSKKPGYQLCQRCLLVVTTGCAVVTRCYSRRAWRKQNSPHLTAPSGIHVVRDLKRSV